MFKNILKSTKELVLEIHETFYTEADRILADAMKIKEAVISNTDEYEKGKNLAELGFTQSPSASNFFRTEERRRQIEEENEEKKLQSETVLYFQQKYPNYKYISIAGVKRICEKYGLIYGSVTRFIGDVPKKNLSHILEAKIDDSDLAYFKRGFEGISFNNFHTIMSYYEYHSQSDGFGFNYVHISESGKTPLEIAAPKKDFDFKDAELVGFELKNKTIEIPDPVVLQPVFHNGKKHYLIITAWGDEASDELVVNQKMN